MSQQKITTESRAHLTLKYEYVDFIRDCQKEFRLYTDGTFTVNDVVHPWFKDEQTQKPWIPAKRKTFKSLVKQSIREGDFD